MGYLEALVFGFVQGITEFLPISSTAHIIITELLLGYNFPGLAFEIFLHLASALAVICYFRRQLVAVVTGFFSFFFARTKENRVQFYFGLYIILATLITGVVGLLLKGQVQDVMKTPPFMAGALIVTGTFLIIIERFRRYGNRTEKNMTILDAIIVGLGQTVAVMPGISRSGATLVTALWVGLERETAVRFSFLLAIPVILGSSVLALDEIGTGMWTAIGAGPLAVAFIATFLFSLLGIVWLIDFLQKGRLLYFALYCYFAAFMVFNFVQEVSPGF